MKPSIVLCADFDGTLFDPSIKILLSPVYNNHTSRLLKKNNILFVINTGRPIWDRFAHLQNMAIGLHKPDVVIAGAGTKIMWKQKVGYEVDSEWDQKIEATKWDIEKVRSTIIHSSKETKLDLFDTANPYMARAWVYNKSVKELDEIKKDLENQLPDTKIVLTEQILLPNTTEQFSGYLLFIPKIAGKERAAKYVIDKLQAKYETELKRIYAGDALVDVAMLMYDTPARSASYGLNLTPLAREALKNTQVIIRDGSPPAQLLGALKDALRTSTKPQNSPFRTLVKPFEAVVDKAVFPTLTPNEISYKGVELAQKGLQKIYGPQSDKKSKFSGLFTVLGGTLIDVVDGIRARRHPTLKTENGQLVDGYADRNKEFIQLAMRANTRADAQKTETFAAALSCFLPSIARAQAECLGAIVPEYDSAGGSALSRNKNLLVSLLYSASSFDSLSYKSDMNIYDKNMKTYTNRKSQTGDFSWSKLNSYDQASSERLKLYVEMFQKAVKETHMHDWVKQNDLEEYYEVKIKPSVLNTITSH